MNPPRQRPKYLRESAKIYVVKLGAIGVSEERLVTGEFT
jgi:hypothetical protein